MKAVLIITFIAGLLAFTAKDKLTGRWETTPDENGVITGIGFKPGNTFEMYVNKKPFASGTYALDDNIISFVVDQDYRKLFESFEIIKCIFHPF